MFIQTEDTPNPATMKFLPGREVSSVPVDIDQADKAHLSPLAQTLFAIKGVTGVFLGADFISVTRNDDKDWTLLRPLLLAAIMNHFVEGRPVLAEGAEVEIGAPAPLPANDEDVETRVRQLLDQRIRPAVAQDGGDVAFEKYEDGVVYLRLKGACSGCPSATITLKHGIENMMRHFIPEVKEVRRVM